MNNPPFAAMNYIGLNTCDTANGAGIRVSLFVSGCRMHCKGCFNKESWDFKAGKEFTSDTWLQIYNALKNPYIKGFSVLGGEPMEPENQEELIPLLRKIRLFLPNKDIWLWTGHKFEDIKDSPIITENLIDVLVDGAFVEHRKGNHLMWRGSSNQRIISLKPEPKDISKEINNEYSAS